MLRPTVHGKVGAQVTSSARASMDGVTVKPSDLVELRSVVKTSPVALISTAAVRTLAAIVMSWSMFLLAGITVRSENAVETVVFIRHGEKPDKGLGQLNCQGLNRALALPPVIAKLFGRPDVIFAPSPSAVKMDDGVPYAYVRPSPQSGRLRYPSVSRWIRASISRMSVDYGPLSRSV